MSRIKIFQSEILIHKGKDSTTLQCKYYFIKFILLQRMCMWFIKVKDLHLGKHYESLPYAILFISIIFQTYIMTPTDIWGKYQQEKVVGK